MAYHEAGTRIRVTTNVIIPLYQRAPDVVHRGATGVIVKAFPGEEAYSVLLDSTKDEDDTHFLYDYEVEAIASGEEQA